VSLAVSPITAHKEHVLLMLIVIQRLLVFQANVVRVNPEMDAVLANQR